MYGIIVFEQIMIMTIILYKTKLGWEGSFLKHIKCCSKLYNYKNLIKFYETNNTVKP